MFCKKNTMLRAILFLITAMLCSSCKDKPIIQIGSVYTIGPSIDPDGKLLSNVITFHYEAKDPEPVHLVLDENRVKTVMIEGKVNWRIEVHDRKVRISNGETIMEVPISEEGTLDSDVSVNKSRQMVFDISVNSRNVLRIECPTQIIDSPKITYKAEH
jgi:hypothetical protein